VSGRRQVPAARRIGFGLCCVTGPVRIAFWLLFSLVCAGAFLSWVFSTLGFDRFRPAACSQAA